MSSPTLFALTRLRRDTNHCRCGVGVDVALTVFVTLAGVDLHFSDNGYRIAGTDDNCLHIVHFRVRQKLVAISGKFQEVNTRKKLTFIFMEDRAQLRVGANLRIRS
ncbi:hypothetical protein ACN9MG_23225 [Burkholderia ambifaria]|jgi:hypothetical protein|uniref:hypothetical protein n=1 Tax=Burkholderia TaxID=32008 RepID=UPI00158DBE82|nr:hypothetical protein [Burkholderia ambifaria]